MGTIWGRKMIRLSMSQLARSYTMGAIQPISQEEPEREGHETPPGVEVTCYPVPDISRRQQGEKVESVSGVWEAKDQEDFSTGPLGILKRAMKNNSQVPGHGDVGQGT